MVNEYIWGELVGCAAGNWQSRAPGRSKGDEPRLGF